MNIEYDVFNRSTPNYNKLVDYGFYMKDNFFLYETTFFDSFKAIISINHNGEVSGKVIDTEIDEEYTNIRTDMNGKYVSNVRDNYIKLLKDIRDNCFDVNNFIFDQSNRISKYIKDKYKVTSEFLWEKHPGFGVFRNMKNNKWFGIIMNIDLSKLDSKSGEVEIINLKLNPEKAKLLLEKNGFYKAYHMNKRDWISVLLNDSLSDDEIISLVDESYSIIDDSEKWIVPANPKYYDVINAFNDTDEIIWKQSSNINIGDIVYLYVAAPYSKIMYKCVSTEVNIPYNYIGKNVSINYAMKIKLLERMDGKNYTFEYLNSIGIKTIRGHRKISIDISNKIL